MVVLCFGHGNVGEGREKGIIYGEEGRERLRTGLG
jgi:hypothetical protein